MDETGDAIGRSAYNRMTSDLVRVQSPTKGGDLAHLGENKIDAPFTYTRQTASKRAGGAPMGSQSLLALTSRRAEVSECIRLLEGRSRERSGLAVNQLIERLRRKADWLDRRIDLESLQSDPTEPFFV